MPCIDSIDSPSAAQPGEGSIASCMLQGGEKAQCAEKPARELPPHALLLPLTALSLHKR